MTLRYPHLSSGYIATSNEQQTLNAKFFSIFDMDSVLSKEIILFPQRVPRKDFFTELNKLETAQFRVNFDKQITSIRECLIATSNIAKCEETIRDYLNAANIGLRFGCFNEILQHRPNNACDSPYSLEIEIICEAAQHEDKLSRGLPISADHYDILASRFLNKQSVTDREKIMLLNNLVVTHYRHANLTDSNKYISSHLKQFATLLEKFETKHPLNQLYCSVGHRALAMASELGPQQQEAHLIHAEKLATEMNATSYSDEIVKLENQFTCYQTIAKWHIQNNDIEQAETYLGKLISIDPFDSTGYSELGCFYFNNNEIDKAATHFKKAMELGPPGTGMNAYFYATCLEQLGQRDDAIIHLLKAARLDNQAVSPWMDLFHIYKNNPHESINSLVIAKHLQTTPELWEQLDHDEQDLIKYYTH